jgi:crotonobetainyl-CoA:carnitine CoA-transferase CaiB-like acyl-CoA transferase
MKPLEGITVLDFSQFLAGPAAAMRLADLGARVIKVERPVTGDICRQLYISNMEIEGESTLFHSINRNKQSYSANLKNEDDLNNVLSLIKNADVLIGNFRPGVMAKLGLSADTVCKVNPKLIYGTVTGYGTSGPWKHKPGQDLLAQAMSGLTWLSGSEKDPPTPMGIAVADLTASAHLVQGILACLVRRGVTGKGGRIEVSLMESILDLQFEVITTHLNDGGKTPSRSAINNGHAYIAAPYGIYKTADGYLALAMANIVQLGNLMDCPELQEFEDNALWFTQRDTIKEILKNLLHQQTTQYWLDILEPADVWCAEVMNWAQLRKTEGYQTLDMEQTVTCPGGTELKTLRSPIRIDGEIYKSSQGAPLVGQHTDEINEEFSITQPLPINS